MQRRVEWLGSKQSGDSIFGMAAPRVMVVEDEGPLSDLLQRVLETEGYSVEVVEPGVEAKAKLRDDLPDLLIQDLATPGLPGFVLRRNDVRNVPTILLVDRKQDGERARGSAQHIDYLVKPFSEPELIVRARALLKRVRPEVLSDVVTVQDLMLDRRQHQVYRSNRLIPLGPTEFRLLEVLIQAPGRVFSRFELIDGIWGDSEYGEGRALDVAVVRLRKAINTGFDVDLIKTVRGSGYSIGRS